MPKINELRERAKQLGLKNNSKLSKRELIWGIQMAEGYDQCYERIMDCAQEDCWFRPDCLAHTA